MRMTLNNIMYAPIMYIPTHDISDAFIIHILSDKDECVVLKSFNYTLAIDVCKQV